LISTKFSFADGATRILLVAAAAFFVPVAGWAQSTALDELPDAPQATAQQSQPAQAPATTPSQTPATTPSQSQTAPAQTQSQATPQTGSSSSAQPAPTAPETKEQREERARRELEAEEHQRVLGVVPMFNVQSDQNAAPLTSKQKYQLFFKSSTDWYVFAITAIDGEISLLGKEYPSYGEGVEGFAKYWGAAYADTFDGNLWGNAILTSWWKEDPRYYRMGHGKFIKRVGYSAFTTIWCKRDEGTWGPNYANVAGNFIGGAISNIYYPSDQRGVVLSLGRGASVTYEGIVGAEIAEFWPDIAQHFMKKHPDKLDKQAAQQPAASAAPPPTTNPQPTTTPGTRMQPEGNQTPTPNPQDQKPQDQKPQ
jgi:hypothetical protein